MNNTERHAALIDAGWRQPRRQMDLTQPQRRPLRVQPRRSGGAPTKPQPKGGRSHDGHGGCHDWP